MNTSFTMHLGGALLAAAIAANANAQCNLVQGNTLRVNPLDFNWDTHIATAMPYTISNGKLYAQTDVFTSHTISGDILDLEQIQIWDISNPLSGVRLSESVDLDTLFFDTGLGEQLAVSGDTLIGRRGGNLILVDITDPVNPIEIGSLPSASQFYASGPLLYAETGSAFVVYDLSNPLAPVELGSLSGSYDIGPPVGTRIPFENSATDVGILDVSDPTSPVVLSSMTGALGSGAVLVGNAVVLTSSGNFLIFDFSIPGSPAQLPDFPNPAGTSTHYHSIGLFMYASDGYDMYAIDFSDPSAPFVADSDLGPASLDNMIAAGGAIVGLQSNGGPLIDFIVYDVSSCSVEPIIVNSPLSRLVDESTTPEVFTVNATGAVGFQWFKDNVAVSNGGDYSGATTPSLSVAPNKNTEGFYTCTVSNSDGSATTAPAILGVRAGPCDPDLNDDGEINVLDLLIMLTAWGMC